MKCSRFKICGNDLPEEEIQLSHDVPKYMFKDKKEADWYGRHYLCAKCHNIYERLVFSIAFNSLPESWQEHIIKIIKDFAGRYFSDDRRLLE